MDIQTFASGSSGNSSLLTQGDTYILIDAGISMRRITKSLLARGVLPERIDGIVITHEHNDHIKGLKMLLKYWDTKIFTTGGTAREILRFMPQAEGRIIEITPGKKFDIGAVEITPVRTMHDAAQSVGFTFESSGEKIAYFTDMGKITREVVDAAEGARSIVLEANHDIEMLKNGVYPYHLKARILSDYGHLSNKRCGEFAAWLGQNGTKNIVLAHLSRENNRPHVAYDTVAEIVEAKNSNVNLSVAPPDCEGELCLC